MGLFGSKRSRTESAVWVKLSRTTGSPPLARVQIDLEEGADRRDIALLAALTAYLQWRDLSRTPYAMDFTLVLSEIANRLIKAAAIQGLDFRKLLGSDEADSELVSQGVYRSGPEALVRASVPGLTEELRSDDRRPDVRLSLNKDRYVNSSVVEIKSKRRERSPFVRIAAVLSTIECVAKTEDYLEVTRPAAFGIHVLTRTCEEFDAGRVKDRSQVEDLKATITAVVSADEPYEVADEFFARLL